MIGGLLVLLFGAKRLPELGKSFGQGLREFKKSVSGALDEADEADKKPSSPNPEDAVTK
jgi:sec-independent protein translocase protein TatA